MKTLAWVAFHNPDWCDGPDISPVVHNHWSRPVVDLLLESEAPFHTVQPCRAGLVPGVIGWCSTRPDVDTAQILVGCDPERPNPEGVTDEAGGGWRAVWYERAIRRLAAWELCVLVDSGHVPDRPVAAKAVPVASEYSRRFGSCCRRADPTHQANPRHLFPELELLPSFTAVH